MSDKALREHLRKVLTWSEAHLDWAAALRDFDVAVGVHALTSQSGAAPLLASALRQGITACRYRRHSTAGLSAGCRKVQESSSACSAPTASRTSSSLCSQVMKNRSLASFSGTAGCRIGWTL